MDKIVKKVSRLGVPALVLAVAISISGLRGGAAILAALVAIGPGGILGGIATLGVIGLLSEGIAEFGIDAVFKAIVDNLLAQGESYASIRRKILSYPISSTLKSLLLCYLSEY